MTEADKLLFWVAADRAALSGDAVKALLLLAATTEGNMSDSIDAANFALAKENRDLRAALNEIRTLIEDAPDAVSALDLIEGIIGRLDVAEA